MSQSTVPESVQDSSDYVQGMFPGLWWNTDRDQARIDRVRRIRESISDSDAIGVVDSDADGLACEVVLREKYENPTVIVAGSSQYGISFTQALNIISDSNTDSPVIIADLSPDVSFSSYLASIASVNSDVYVYDHHDWSWTAQTSVRNVVNELAVGEDKCAAQILQENLYPEADEDLKEFLSVTADHDLWKKNDERSDHLSTLSFELDRETYIENARMFGADMLEESEELQDIYQQSEGKSNRQAELAIENAEIATVNDVNIAVTYFDCHQSRVGDRLIEDHNIDLAVIIQPTGSVSFRSTEEFGRCAELARELGGGGHKDAAGANIYTNVELTSENWSEEDLYVPEVDSDPDQINVSDLNKLELLWRLEGQPATDYMWDYLQSAV